MSAPRSVLLVALACLLLTPAAASGQITFVDVTTAAGVDYVHSAYQLPPDCSFAGFYCSMDQMTGGAAAGDYDRDGDPDLYVTRIYDHDLLFRNDGDGTFTDVTGEAGLDAFVRNTNGALWVDVDNDRDLDLYVTGMGEPRHFLFINDGAGGFTEEGQARGAALDDGQAHGGMGLAAGDYDGDGWRDLFVGEWRGDFMAPGAAPNARLLRNRGAEGATFRGVFEDVTDTAGVDVNGLPNNVDEPGHYVFGPAFVDLDGDLRLDLVLASDFGTSRIFWNRGDGTFLDGTVAAGVGGDENGMGSTFGDADGDGALDWFITSIFDPTPECLTETAWGCTGNRLYRNEGGRTFGDVTGDEASGVRDGSWGWGAAFFDPDNDGDLDLVMTNGIDFNGDPTDGAFHADPMRLWRNEGPGVWSEQAAAVGLTDTGEGKGLLVFDYDLDGDQDLFVVNNRLGGLLYRNDGGSDNDWLRVAVRADWGLGGRVEVWATPAGPPQVQPLTSATHYLGQSEAVAHFGLGAPGAGAVHAVRIVRPTGASTWHYGVPRNTTFTPPPWPACGLGFELAVLVPFLALARQRMRPSRKWGLEAR